MWNWDSEKTAIVRDLYINKDYSASAIAREIELRFRGHCSRNSVSGAIFRMKLRKNGAGKYPVHHLRISKPKQKPAKRKPRSQPTPPQLNFYSPPTSGIECPCQLDELGRFNCRWAIGHPREAGFYFCGAVVTPGKTYCPTHLALAHEPAKGSRQQWRAATMDIRTACRPMYRPIFAADPVQAALERGFA
jgi:GcrA cell cycle regulator